MCFFSLIRAACDTKMISSVSLTQPMVLSVLVVCFLFFYFVFFTINPNITFIFFPQELKILIKPVFVDF